MYLLDYQQVPEARASIRSYFEFYNFDRPHQSLDYQTPAVIYLG